MLINGNNGNNVLIGTNFHDDIFGRGGNDRIQARNGNDLADGGSGNDIVEGGGGNDIVRGGAGNDTVNGGAGNDNVNGGGGRDRLIGGTGEDNFDFNLTTDSNSANRDLIDNFDFGGVDTIDVSTIDADQRPGAIGNQDFFFNGTTNGGVGSLWVVDVGASNFVLANVDDDPTAEFQVEVQNGIPAIFWADFNFVLS
jgi:Ca2+-binding RTX toxin-like protein